MLRKSEMVTNSFLIGSLEIVSVTARKSTGINTISILHNPREITVLQ